ncbi:hypothetical protein [Novipirellula sp.]|uniref:hypothetical protein n=1 Tax=Novipirellula sp. TaxID=2795430 RepID=UPI003566A953
MKRWLRISVRTLLAITTILALMIGYLSNRLRGHKAAVTAIRAHGGTFAIKYDGPDWLRAQFDDDEYFYNCVRVNLGPYNKGYDRSRPIGDDDVEALIPHLNAFSNFQILDLRRSSITDGVTQLLDRIDRLDAVILWETKISDEGLDNMPSIPSLTHLDVRNTLVTPDGVGRFVERNPQCKVRADFVVPNA